MLFFSHRESHVTSSTIARCWCGKNTLLGIFRVNLCFSRDVTFNDGVPQQKQGTIDLFRNRINETLTLNVPGLSSRFAFCYNLTPYNLPFLLYLKTDDTDRKVNITVVLESEGEELLSHVNQACQRMPNRENGAIATFVPDPLLFSVILISLPCKYEMKNQKDLMNININN